MTERPNEEEEKESKISSWTIIMIASLILLVAIGIFAYYTFTRNKYSNPLDCNAPFNASVDSSSFTLAKTIYESPNCYKYELVNDTYTLYCCRDLTTRYKHTVPFK